MRGSTWRALMSSPPIASLSSIWAGGSGDMADGPGAGRGLPICGACAQATVASTAEQLSAIIAARRSVGTGFPLSNHLFCIRNHGFTATELDLAANGFDGGTGECTGGWPNARSPGEGNIREGDENGGSSTSSTL